MPTAKQMEASQLAYSRRLNENQNAALAKRDAAFKQQAAGSQPWTVEHMQEPPKTNGDPTGGMFAPLFMAGLLLGTVLLLGLLAARRQNRRRRAAPLPGPGYTAAPSLLTPTEAQFHAVLVEAVGPMATIQCKVRLADLLTTQRGDYASFNRVSQKHVDFVLCHRQTLRPLVAVELDDPSHDRPDRQARDRFVDAAYAQAGLPLVHIRTAHAYSPAALLSQLQPFLLS